MNDREKYEQLILASPLFSLDREQDRVAYQRESRKMVENLYLYLLSINEKRYVEYGLEITETANRCIENFDASSGNFLHYFNASMAKEYRRAREKRKMQETRSGLHVSAEDDKNIRKVLKLMNVKGISDPTEEQIRQMAEILDMPVSKVSDAILSTYETAVVSDVTCQEDGEETSLFDTIASEENIENSIVSIEDCHALLAQIQRVYDGCQERQKPIVSAMMTIKIAKIVYQQRLSTESFSFVNKQIMTTYLQSGRLPTQRDIAELFGKNEASVSRTVKEFIGKITYSQYEHDKYLKGEAQ